MNTPTPVKFGKYYLLEKIATGGMAELFRAKLTGAQGFEKLIAIKKILQHLNSEDKLVSSFIDEAKLAALIHHPNIVQVYDFGYMNETYYIAMEYLFGKDLRFTIKRTIEKSTSIDFEISLYIVSQLLSGLDYAHTLKDFSGNPLKIIHRDIGPQNIFITYDGQVKIIDFGIAKAATQDTNTQIGTIKGKVSYMSPEQANGDVVDHRSDIFSAGIVLYELLTLRKMYEGDTFQVLAKARNASFEPIENINPNFPKAIYGILTKALEKNPDRRYQTAESMLQDIDSFMVDNSIRLYQKDLSSFMKYLFDEENEDFKTQTIVNTNYFEVPQNDDNNCTIITADVHTKNEYKKHIFDLLSKKRKIVYGASFFLTMALFIFAYGDGGKVRIERIVDNVVERSKGIKADHDEAEIMQGVSALERKNYKEAVALFENALKNNPSSFDRILFHYSKALTAMGETLMASSQSEARITLEKSYKINPENSQTCFLLGKIFTVLKNNRTALEYYEKAAALDPANPDVYFNMGYSYAVLDDYGKAKEMYREVIDFAPSFVDQAYFNLALIEEKTGMKKDAIEHMKKALEINPLNTNAARFLETKKL
ncbi:MAG: protein kinase [Desulfobacteraceae bacterium]|jgi:serine/threonine protein kinase